MRKCWRNSRQRKRSPHPGFARYRWRPSRKRVPEGGLIGGFWTAAGAAAALEGSTLPAVPPCLHPQGHAGTRNQSASAVVAAVKRAGRHPGKREACAYGKDGMNGYLGWRRLAGRDVQPRSTAGTGWQSSQVVGHGADITIVRWMRLTRADRDTNWMHNPAGGPCFWICVDAG